MADGDQGTTPMDKDLYQQRNGSVIGQREGDAPRTLRPKPTISTRDEDDMLRGRNSEL